MTKTAKRYTRLMLCLLLCLAMLFSVPLCVSAEDKNFESSISAFPESYRVLLRELHNNHPLWEFKPLMTGLDWNDAVNAECSYGRSLVTSSSAYANAFRSKAEGDYNYSTGKYIEKDGGFVTANKFAVSYFMDPRNFLNDDNIFQFEDLSFNESFNVKAVDVVLSGTFMYNSKATYYTASGEQKTSNETYAEMMYTAGKTYNINPCYLAAKIRNEIGNGSGSVSGKNATYPGIYNFYNIGASDGAGAIARGLKWASDKTSGTYNRPWTTPKKSILGGAEYIANTYIAKGQYTGYLQKFNVNPNGTYNVYDHQYMTNISGATSQGYSAYYSYLSIGLLDNRFVFSIPVYNNMPGANNNSGTLKLNDASSQTGKVDGSSPINVRTGPSTNHDKLPLQLAGGASVTILDCVKTDSVYYDSILRYPSWFKIKFVSGSTTYTGYVPAGFIKVSTKKTVPLGEYTPSVTTDNSSLSFNYISLDVRKATVTDDKKINFIAAGDVPVIAYDSSGRYSIVNYTVSETAEPLLPAVTGFAQSDVTKTSFTFSWSPVAGAAGYRVYMLNTSTNTYDAYLTTQSTSCQVSGLSAGKIYKLRVKAYKLQKDGSKKFGNKSADFNAVTLPKAPTAITNGSSNSSSVMLSWNAVPNATSYIIYKCNPGESKFKKLEATTANAYGAGSLSPSSDYKFKIKTVISINGKDYISGYSTAITAKTGPAVVSGLTQKKATANSVTLSWNAVKNAAGYAVYKIDYSTFEYVSVGKTTGTSYVIKNLTAGQKYTYCVRAYETSGSKTYYGSDSAALTATTLPAKVKSLKQSNATSTTVTLKWNSIAGVSGYGVYKLNANGKYKKIATVTSNSCKVKNLGALSTNKFKVRAFINNNGKTYWGAYSAVITGYTAPPAVKGVKLASDKAESFKLKWTAQSNVTGYRILVYSNSKKSYSKIASVTKNNATISKSGNGEIAVYVVRAYKTINGKNYYGDYSSPISVTK